MADRNDDIFEGDEMEQVNIAYHETDIELKEGEKLVVLVVDFPEGQGSIVVREREMKAVTTVLVYNQYPYYVRPIGG